MRIRLLGSGRIVRLIGLIVALLALQATAGLGRERFPYRASIAFDDTPVFSGPNDGFYATDYLAAGATVDVLRRDPGGWLAIRPPVGSFSWVPADHLEFTDRADEAEVVIDRTQVWIGSRVETVRDHHWQVSLETGQFVRVLGRRSLGDGRSSRSGEWIQVAPPHGELRWVHESKLKETAERHSAALARQRAAAHRARIEDSASSVDSSAVASSAERREPLSSGDPAAVRPESRYDAAEPQVSRAAPQAAPADFAEFPAVADTAPVGSDFSIEPAQFARSPARVRSDPAARDRGTPERLPPERLPLDGSPASQVTPAEGAWREARRRRGVNAAGAPVSESPGSGAPAIGLPATGLSDNGALGVSGFGAGTWPSAGAPRAPYTPDAGASDPNSLPFSARQAELELEDISLQLSAMVARDTASWNFGPLLARAEELIERAPAPLDRGRARLLYDKIAAFEENRRQFDQATRAPVAATAPAGAAGASAAASGTGSALGVSDKEPRFDGSGWLLPVHSTKQLAPPFALMDDEGRVLQYVTPAAGLNLHRYTRKRIGIYGQRGTFPSLNAPLLTAHRIVELDRHAR